MVGARFKLRLERLELDLALIELMRPRDDQLLARRTHRREVLLALPDRLELCREPRPLLHELPFLCRECLLAHTELVDRRARLVPDVGRLLELLRPLM